MASFGLWFFKFNPLKVLPEAGGRFKFQLTLGHSPDHFLAFDNIDNVAGYFIEDWIYKKEPAWERIIPDIWWAVKNFPDKRFVIINGGGSHDLAWDDPTYNENDGDNMRLQALASWLFVKDMGADVWFGWQGWKRPEDAIPQVVITPEQFINFGSASSGDYASFTWDPIDPPELEELEGHSGDDGQICEKDGEKYVIREFENGFALINYTWTGSKTTISLAELQECIDFPDPVYELHLDIDGVLVDEGARLWTEKVSLDDAFVMGEYFTKIFLIDPIASPEPDTLAANTLTEFWGDDQVLSVTAEPYHTGVPLQIRADLKSWGFSGDQRYLVLPYEEDSGLYRAQLPENLYSLDTDTIPLLSVGSDGLRTYSDLLVNVNQAPEVTLVNKSDKTGQLQSLPTPPVNSVALDYDQDGYTDLFIAAENQGYLYRRYTEEGADEFEFRDRTGVDIPLLEVPHGFSRAFAVADMNNDEYDEVFVAHATQPRLYQWEPSGSTPQFQDRLSEVFSLLGITQLQNSTSASWADYDRDGLLDLVVGRAGVSADALADTLNNPGVVHQPLEPALYHNDGGTLSYVSSGLGGQSYSCYSIQWVDYNLDAWSDLFIADLDSSGIQSCHLLKNTGGTFEDVTSECFGDSIPDGVISARFVDFDNDQDLDLVTACWYQKDNLRLYKNDGSNFFEVVQSGEKRISLESAYLNGVQVGDFDLNGLPDLLAFPGVNDQETVWPYILLNGVGEVPAGQFDRYVTMNDTLGSGIVRSAVIEDWGGDGDLDLLLGRPTNGADFFFQSRRSDGVDIPANNWVQIKLEGDGLTKNLSAVGSRVTAVFGDKTSTQLLTATGDRSGHTPGTLTFGLGDYNPVEGFITVAVVWPDSCTTTRQVSVNALTTIAADSPLIVPGSEEFLYKPGPNGGALWEFTWETTEYADPGQDQVEIFDDNEIGEECYCGGLQVLEQSMSSVSVEVTPNGSTYQHELTWYDACCVVVPGGCGWGFKCQSSSDCKTEQTDEYQSFKTKLCGKRL